MKRSSATQVEEARRQIALRPRQHVGDRRAKGADRVLAERPHELAEARGGAAKRVRGEDRVTPEVQRIGQVVVEDAVDLARADAVGEEARDDRAGAAADVHVEAAAGPVEPLLDGGERADLLHPADHAAPRESQPNAPRRSRRASD